MSNLTPKLMVFLAHAIGIGSLLCLLVFLYLGRLVPIGLGFSGAGALAFDGALCLTFFIQHSGMVRKSFQSWLGRFVPLSYHGAIYSVVSGSVLLVLLVLWQHAHPSVVTVEGPLRFVLRSMFFLGILGFVWGVRSLGRFDGFGTRPLRATLSGKAVKAQPLTIRGAYRWVRHPLYTCVLVLLWSSPDLTADRLLLNASWTAWIFVGTALEERDLVAKFGDSYRQYQLKVPMLLPFRTPRLP